MEFSSSIALQSDVEWFQNGLDLLPLFLLSPTQLVELPRQFFMTCQILPQPDKGPVYGTTVSVSAGVYCLRPRGYTFFREWWRCESPAAGSRLATPA